MFSIEKIKKVSFAQDTCTISYNASGPIGAYAVALQIEDYISASSTTPMSSVPLQFLVNVSDSNRPCSETPVLVLPTPLHGSCIAVPLGITYTTSLIAYSRFTRSSITLSSKLCHIQYIIFLGTTYTIKSSMYSHK